MSEEIVQQIKERLSTDLAFRQAFFTSSLQALQAYELTEEEKEAFILPNFSWLLEKRLAGVSYPRSAEAFALLQKQGVQALLSLSEETPPAELLQTYGLASEHLPLADFSAPTLAQVARALTMIDGFLAQSMPVAVHCGAGLGRTGTLLACYLVSQGSSAQAAIEQVRAKRPGSIETPEQEAVIKAYDEQRREQERTSQERPAR